MQTKAVAAGGRERVKFAHLRKSVDENKRVARKLRAQAHALPRGGGREKSAGTRKMREIEAAGRERGRSRARK